jgi:MscS family membrane protein
MLATLAQAIPFAQSSAAGSTQPASTRPSEAEQFLHQLNLNDTFDKTPWTAWGVLLLAIFGGVVAGKLLNSGAKAVAKRARDRAWYGHACLFDAAAGPIYLWAITVGLTIGLAPIELSPAVRVFATGVLKLMYIIAIGWFLFEAIGLTDVILKRFTQGHDNASTLESQVVPLVRKSLRIFLVVVFVLFAAQNVFGADIGAWLAGLGIAGLAVSLAAQDSIKNVFGSLTIFLDKPFKVGERIVFDGHDGPVEEIGFRSTKIRTGAGDLVTIPNAKIVDGSVRNIGRRPNIPRNFTVTLPHDTPADKLKEAVRIVESIFDLTDVAEGFKETNPPRVYVDELTPTAVTIRVWYWFFPASDWWGYMAHAQRFNLELVQRFGAAGIDFARPVPPAVIGTSPNAPQKPPN